MKAIILSVFLITVGFVAVPSSYASVSNGEPTVKDEVKKKKKIRKQLRFRDNRFNRFGSRDRRFNRFGSRSIFGRRSTFGRKRYKHQYRYRGYNRFGTFGRPFYYRY